MGAAAADDDERVAAGDFVTVEYTARLESGVVVDSSDAEEGAPLKFVAGSNSVLRGLSDGVIGLALRDLTKLELEPAVAYGERDETRVMKVPSQNLPAGAAVGSQIMVAAPGAAAQKGSGTPAVIRDLGGDDGVATIDLNHPLAGQRLLFDLVVTSRKEPRSVASGDFVSVQYRAMLTEADGGGVVDASTPGTPLEFVAGGDGAVLPGLAKRVVGLAVGVRTELLLEPEEAFGQRDPSNVAEVPRSQMPEGELNVGARLKLQVEGGETPAIISEVTDEVVKLDLNSPLAGKQLLFDVEIVNLVPQDRVDDLGGGLIMETKTPGDGVSRPQPGQTVLLHFVGLLQDGSVFRSTVEEGAPVRITLEGTRACNMGLDVAASRMSVGQRTILRVPSSRAYGSEGSEDGKVPADADLRFFLELAAIE